MAKCAEISLFCLLSGKQRVCVALEDLEWVMGHLALTSLSLQVQHLDALSGEDLLLTGEVSWRPLVESNARSILKPLSPVYNDEGL